MRYRSRIPNPAHVAPIGIVVVPGQEFDSPIGLHHPELEPLDDEAKAYAEQVAAENARLAAEHAQRISGQGAGPQEPMPDYRAALGLPPLPPTPEPTDEERRIRGFAPAEPPAEPAAEPQPQPRPQASRPTRTAKE